MDLTTYTFGFICGAVVTVIAQIVFGTCKDRIRDRTYEPDIHDL